jgi:hypothetical protein
MCAALVRWGERAVLPLLSCSASHWGCAEHVGGGEVGLYHLAGHLGQPYVVGAGVVAQALLRPPMAGSGSLC